MTYHTPRDLLDAAWRTLDASRDYAQRGEYAPSLELVIVDNTEPPDPAVRAFADENASREITVISGHGNVGYGAGHNLAIGRVKTDYHLVLNPDVELATDALERALLFMHQNPNCGLLAPIVFDEHDVQQFLCKRYPALLDLFLRGFAPAWLARVFRRRLDRYEMRDLVSDAVLWDPVVVSGCFMFFRTAVLKRVGGFDQRYFLYMEDFDLTLRVASASRVAYVPAVRILHRGGHAARKGLQHIRMFGASLVKFYRKNGWKWV